MIDIGGQSTKPGAELISAEEELSRIIPVIKAFRSTNTSIFFLFLFLSFNKLSFIIQCYFYVYFSIF